MDLVVTSPPYPMIEMWDSVFGAQDSRIRTAIEAGDGTTAFVRMHEVLDAAWRECHRVLRPGGFLCVNIGDAVRTIGAEFRLYANHARVTGACEAIGFSSLPAIHWRKPTNAPTKFMGSGMLPAGAYVTLEHEYIRIFRKGGKRVFLESDRAHRRRSAYFWEERNLWFSDTWELQGVRQTQNGDLRTRSGAFPLELAFRLVNMYSLLGETVLDPFAGTGTTTRAAIGSARSSIACDLDPELVARARKVALDGREDLNDRQRDRLREHERFLSRYREKHHREPRYENIGLRTAVVTAQEREIQIPYIHSMIEEDDGAIVVNYEMAGQIGKDGME